MVGCVGINRFQCFSCLIEFENITIPVFIWPLRYHVLTNAAIESSSLLVECKTICLIDIQYAYPKHCYKDSLSTCINATCDGRHVYTAITPYAVCFWKSKIIHSLAFGAAITAVFCNICRLSSVEWKWFQLFGICQILLRAARRRVPHLRPSLHACRQHRASWSWQTLDVFTVFARPMDHMWYPTLTHTTFPYFYDYIIIHSVVERRFPPRLSPFAGMHLSYITSCEPLPPFIHIWS